MDIYALNKANIDNLTSLWKKMGTQQHCPFTINELHESTSWPNRCWFDWDNDTHQITAMQEIPIQFLQHSIVPVWGGVAESPNPFEHTLIEEEFEVVFEQTAMYLDLESYVASEHRQPQIKRIHSRQDIETWTHISGAAFGYEIDLSVIDKIAGDSDVQLLLAYSEGQAAGTTLLYKTADVIGVHQVGVIEKHQRKGIAYALMQYAIDACTAWQANYITLQASEAGEALYKRLGFRGQFKIRNYQRVSKS